MNLIKLSQKLFEKTPSFNDNENCTDNDINYNNDVNTTYKKHYVKEPFCKNCLETKSDLVPLKRSSFLGSKWYFCDSCKRYFLKE